jgi:hypothetical protein
MKRSKFSLSHYKLLTMNLGGLIPVANYEVLPGDTVQHSTSALIRVSPLLAPLMHPVKVRLHHWFVPYRLIWEDWEDFITGGPDGTFTATPPYITETGELDEGTLQDYFGIPPGDYTGNDLSYSALPFRAYALIFNEYYRDQDLVDEIAISVASGADSTTPTDILNCAWEKDYFTTARPWAQKGDDVLIPIAGSAAVTGIGVKTQTFGASSGAAYETDGTGSVTYDDFKSINPSTGDREVYIEEDPNNAGFPNVRATFDGAEITVGDLREALAIQRYQEARARYGSRYVEYLRYLGVKNPSDSRLQNPEYIGGGKAMLQFSEILQTSETGSTPIGTMAGHGISAIRTKRYRRFFEEHGVVISLMSVLPKAIYANALHRSWTRQTKEDFFQKELQYIGEQQVLAGEVNALQADRSELFGYVNRFDEYRWHPSQIAGEFRDTLNYWHYARQFASDVALNSTFVTANPTTRVYASGDTDSLYVMANNSIQARRILAANPTPKTF